jgi:hypothetical protein
VSRADYVRAVGLTTRSPTEAEWEELEKALEPLRRHPYPGLTDRELLAAVQARHTIGEWKRRHGLEAADWLPDLRASADRVEREAVRGGVAGAPMSGNARFTIQMIAIAVAFAFIAAALVAFIAAALGDRAGGGGTGENSGEPPALRLTPTATSTTSSATARETAMTIASPAPSNPGPQGAAVEDVFDDLPLGPVPSPWEVTTDGATFEVTPLPTAVRRSAALSADGTRPAVRRRKQSRSNPSAWRFRVAAVRSTSTSCG